jgi:hypothetical protein
MKPEGKEFSRVFMRMIGTNFDINIGRAGLE